MEFTKIALASMVLGGSLLLSACGGGDGGGSGLSLNGTAAVGKPVVGTVVATCKTGTGTVVSNSDGSYNVYINGGAGPCLLKITPDEKTISPMYSVSSGSGASQISNITPLTSYLVTYLRSVPGMAATSPEEWFKLPNTAGLLANTAALNERIVRDFIPALNKLVPGLDLSISFLSTAFVANPNSSIADAQLEKLKAAFIANPELVTAILQQLIQAAKDDVAVLGATGATGAGN